MEDLQNAYQEAAKVLRNAQNILFVCHRRPDGDTLGAGLGLHFAMKSLGKNTTLACVDQPGERFSFLPDIELFHRSFSYKDFDLIVVSDAGDSKMSGFHEIYPEFLSNHIPILNIDHHISNDYYGKYNLVDPKSASATIIVFKLLRFMDIPLTEKIGISLLAGIYNDTGAFMHSNTTLEVFQIAYELAKTGANISEISTNMFRKKAVSQLRLWGEILKRLTRNEKNVISSAITLKEIHAFGEKSDSTGGVIDFMNAVPDASFALLIAEDEQGHVKGSLRTQHDDVDVAKIASQFGGGGHKKAAGFRIVGKLERETRWKILS